ncbi:hypothetical protein ruthe_01259 [Rubellimicrobium thermophilum DSM 16684]|uniref:Uncharacterized protein n=1 Tax=Rubellimicrobium thermophilum DSM 16684 TaxID=1123069 RepID=S9SJ95_9RHOB|nr:hypothetical protein [Rubellimicrobium thermophilum]EPX86444.1 hypothetical protein ruthe_01259 [Rubellimicrobium thermophilum DSM 16684]
MWVFLNNAFLSIIRPTARDAAPPGHLLVRGRLPGDIERIFPHATVTETPSRDYRFRTLLPQEEVAAALARAVEGIDYNNFKSSVKDSDRHDAYFDVWEAMASAQAVARRRERR